MKWALVPIEPTQDMQLAAQCISSHDPSDIYRAMLFAAPQDNPIRQLITELREKPWHQTPEQVAERLEGMLNESEEA